MNAGAFSRQRGIILHASKRGHKWRKRAMQKLMRETGVVEVKSGSRVVAYRTQQGKTICHKQRYDGFNSAMDALREIHLEQENRSKPIRAYPCDWCGGWHLTSKERGDA